ncbi:MAG: hypothetical protein QGI18_10355 [Candidatus Marinimicrobia bacterium]|nr:hypothetical protein [Candidatus Neomarinimicrobiota bacterium]
MHLKFWLLNISFNIRIILCMHYLRNITLFCTILILNVHNIYAQDDEVRESQRKNESDSYNEIINNEKNFTLQNIDKIQNVIETLDYPSEFNFKQLSLSTYYDINEEEYSVIISNEEEAEKLYNMLEMHYQKIVDVKDYRKVRKSLLINNRFSNDNQLFEHLINKNLNKEEKHILRKYRNGSVLNNSEQQLFTELLNQYPN